MHTLHSGECVCVCVCYAYGRSGEPDVVRTSEYGNVSQETIGRIQQNP